ncbi:MAG: 30S ribosomal protein S1 [Rhodothermales bacterium]
MADDQQKDPEVPEAVEAEATQEEASNDAAEATTTETTTTEATTTEESATPAEAAETVAEVADETPEAVTEEAPAEEPVAEAAAEDTSEEAPTATETVAEAAAEAVVAEAVVAEARKIVGYTGEIEGEVVKLEDLEDRKVGADIPNYDELMQMIDDTLTNVSENEIVEGKIVSIGEKDVVIDIGFKSDGIVSKNEFSHELEPGEIVEVFLERIEDYHGQLVLSKTKADTVKRWQKIEAAHEEEQVLEGTIVRRIKGGMIVELFDGVEAFLPGSQIDVRPVRDFDAYLEKKMEFKIVKLNPVNENIVVSHKALIEKDLEDQRQKILASMEAGQVLEGAVKNITDFGVFIDLGGVDGLLHITDLSWGRVSHPSELVELDQKLNVVVLDYDKDRQRISLGLKQLQPHPWENIGEKYKEDDGAEGKVVSITDYGAFVELEKGIEGLVHISEMSWTEHIKHPSQMVSLGQIVKVKILNIDHDGKKISLGMKQLEPDPWDGIAARYPAGTVLRGTVRNITNFGVFVEIEAGIDGLVHISDLSWTKKIRHPAEYVKKGQELDVVILNIDEGERRISLGHKQIETNPWNDFGKIYSEGTDVEVTVKRFLDNGIEVDLGLELEGVVPGSELKSGPKSFRESYKEGDTLQLRVIKFDPTNKEIILSENAPLKAAEQAEKNEEKKEKQAEQARARREVSDYQKKAKTATGPTTLGELSGLEALKLKMEAAEATTDAAAAADAPAAEAVAEAPAEVEKPKKAPAKKKAAKKEASEEAVAEEAPAEEAVAEAPAEEEEKPKKAPAKKKAAKKKDDEAEAVAEPAAEAEPEAKAETEEAKASE